MKKISIWQILACLIGTLAIIPPATVRAGELIDTTMVSFNIRYGTANDGVNNWQNRRDLVMQTIRSRDPALFGVQECLPSQADELSAEFIDYKMTAAGRNDGQRSGEMCAIFTSLVRYDILDHGVFWLSETPDKAGSKGWDAALPRIATWVKLADKLCRPDTFYVFNTHFDHAGPQRVKTAPHCYRRAWPSWPANCR